MLLIATLVSLLGPAPVPVADVGGCILMNTAKLPVNKRASPLDSISFKVEKSNAKLCYSRPSLKGRNMIGGEAVPYGKIWRTGSNEPTMIHTDGPLEIAGVKVAAGTYSIYTVPGEKEWEVIVNKSITQWGHESSYTAEVQAQEVGRGKVKAETLKAPVEKLTFTVEPNASNAKHLVFEWQTTRVAIPIK